MIVRKRKALIVDDIVTVREVIELFLLDLGIESRQACDNEEALSRIRRIIESEYHLDLITTDICHGRENGIELVRSIRSFPENIQYSTGQPVCRTPIIVLTGGGFTEWNINEIQTIDPGIPVIQKPLTAGQFEGTVDSLLKDRKNE